MTYPVVTDAISLIDTLRTAHQSVEQALSSRELDFNEELTTAPYRKCH